MGRAVHKFYFADENHNAQTFACLWPAISISNESAHAYRLGLETMSWVMWFNSRRIIGYHTVGPVEKVINRSIGMRWFLALPRFSSSCIEFHVCFISICFQFKLLWTTRFSPLLKFSTFYIIHLWDGKLDLCAVTLSFFVKRLHHSFPGRGRLHSIAPETVVIHKLKYDLHYI